MGVFDGIEQLGKVASGFVDGRSEPPAAPQGPTAQIPSSPSGTFGRLGNAVKGAFGSPILDAGQVLIAGMRLTTGWDDPERGDPFGHGAMRFSRAGETVGSSNPGDDWRGAGAQAYAVANRRQASRTESMAMLDRSVLTVIAREAYQVAYHRDKLDDQSNYLGDLSFLTWPIGLAPGAGKAIKTAVELGAVSAALSICCTELYQLSQESNENATELRELAGEYSALTRKAAPPDLGDVPAPLPSDERPGPGPTDQPGPGQPAPTPFPGPAPMVPRSDAPGQPPACAPAPVLPMNPVGGAAGRTASPAEPAAGAAMPTEMMSGMATAFGAVGAMIGSVVAPLAAVLTGAAGAAGQSLSALTPADVGAGAAGEVGKPTPDAGPSDVQSGEDVESGEDPALSGAAAGTGQGSGPAEVVVELEGAQQQPTNTLEPARPAVPPAATRPPQ